MRVIRHQRCGFLRIDLDGLLAGQEAHHVEGVHPAVEHAAAVRREPPALVSTRGHLRKPVVHVASDIVDFDMADVADPTGVDDLLDGLVAALHAVTLRDIGDLSGMHGRNRHHPGHLVFGQGKRFLDGDMLAAFQRRNERALMQMVRSLDQNRIDIGSGHRLLPVSGVVGAEATLFHNLIGQILFEIANDGNFAARMCGKLRGHDAADAAQPEQRETDFFCFDGHD